VTARDVAVVGVHTTAQGHALGRTTLDLTREALVGGLDDAGLSVRDVDGVMAMGFPGGNGLGSGPGNLATQLGQGLGTALPYLGAQGLLYAAAAIRSGLAETVALVHGYAQPPPASPGQVTSYTTPEFEFTTWTGSFTAAQFALQMRRHMHEYGTTAYEMAHGCAVIRNCATVNPDAVMFGRGPYTAQEVLASRLIADPFTLLMCSLVNDGGSCVVVTTAERARDCRHRPVWVLGGAMEQRYTSYYEVPTLEPLRTRPRMVRAFERAGVDHSDVDLVALYDHFASGVIMELEAMGFCQPGEGGPFVAEQAGFGGLPLSTDGGCLGHSHPGNPYNMKIIEAVRQLRGQVADLCPDWRRGVHTFDRTRCRKVPGARVAAVAGPMTGVFSCALLAVDTPADNRIGGDGGIALPPA
jgi:acetyl-CoA acetyltransferase